MLTVALLLLAGDVLALAVVTLSLGLIVVVPGVGHLINSEAVA